MKVYDGPAALSHVAAILKKENPRRVLVLRDSRSYERSGAAADIAVKIPIAEDVQATAARIRLEGSDFLIAVAKAASVWPETEDHALAILSGSRPLAQASVRKLLIPTTAGTGAEVTPFAVVYVAGKKYSLYDSRLPGEYVILAAELTAALPRG